MQLTTRIQDDVLIVTVPVDRVDAAVAVQFKDAVRDATAVTTGRVILDMEQVAFLDSSGLGAVIGVRKQLGASRPLELARLTPAVLKVFRLTRMDSLFALHDGPPETWTGAPADTAHAV